jgi:hypothetical protein
VIGGGVRIRVTVGAADLSARVRVRFVDRRHRRVRAPAEHPDSLSELAQYVVEPAPVAVGDLETCHSLSALHRPAPIAVQDAQHVAKPPESRGYYEPQHNQEHYAG